MTAGFESLSSTSWAGFPGPSRVRVPKTMDCLNTDSAGAFFGEVRLFSSLSARYDWPNREYFKPDQHEPSWNKQLNGRSRDHPLTIHPRPPIAIRGQNNTCK